MGIGSAALSIRNCDIKWTKALEGGFVVGSLTGDDADDGRGGSGGGAAETKVLDTKTRTIEK